MIPVLGGPEEGGVSWLDVEQADEVPARSRPKEPKRYEFRPEIGRLLLCAALGATVALTFLALWTEYGRWGP